MSKARAFQRKCAIKSSVLIILLLICNINKCSFEASIPQWDISEKSNSSTTSQITSEAVFEFFIV